jgi:hypothetical protein
MSETYTDERNFIYSHMEFHAGLDAKSAGKRAVNLGSVDLGETSSAWPPVVNVCARLIR